MSGEQVVAVQQPLVAINSTNQLASVPSHSNLMTSISRLREQGNSLLKEVRPQGPAHAAGGRRCLAGCRTQLRASTLCR